jgi:hypothetical protein
MKRVQVHTAPCLPAGGPPDIVDADDPLGTFEGRIGSVVKAFARADGRELAEYTLPTLPVLDGMAVAGGKLCLSLTNGAIVCIGN